MEDKHALTKHTLPVAELYQPRHGITLLPTLSTVGAKSLEPRWEGEIGRPRYLKGKEPRLQLSKLATRRAS